MYRGEVIKRLFKVMSNKLAAALKMRPMLLFLVGCWGKRVMTTAARVALA